LEYGTERFGNDGAITNPDSGRQPGKEYGQAKPGRTTKKGIPGNWENFPTQPPVCGRNDGVPGGLVGITISKHRNESIKAYGNAIVPAVALQIFKAIQQYETNQTTISPA
jgi:DNA (cytosine-5)-methyltransferase 1